MTPADAPPRILIVEDDGALRTLLSRSLRERGFEATGVRSGPQMREVMEENGFDLIILDIMLPGTNGLDLCRWIRSHSEVPIIIVSARGDNTDRIVGLELGADDYVPKPVDVGELVARIRAVLRRISFGGRGAGEPASRLTKFDGWSVDRRRREVHTPDGIQVILSGGEFDLLCVLLDAPGRVVGREYLLEQSRDRVASGDASDRSVDVLISRLRRKLGAYEGGRDLIKTVRGVGYTFTAGVTR
ncbi:response regulator transcription factor [Parvularcula dongshanensis]|uniref:DNA-binding response OmpR family regulator n=1 Tax=Parvularcula dongshanensis TaxID=1173995 RepID=A0A840I497_9PROT|nr:response regulator transcription factor [Parvularcula dongshanensis]MBB4659101.1 DNA-binding response OmpR family regulator [Parvularcula dongshanensis]